MIAEGEKKRCEPEESLESCAKPTAGGLERKTEYTFFCVRLEKIHQSGCFEDQSSKVTHEERIADNPIWRICIGLDIGACVDIENGAETTAVADLTSVQVSRVDWPRGSPE